ncbi:MAG: EAL domain-containing protein [Magnetococcales bacterium]|nr:EAL domain-containing protein [Magnetococcales bacterium]
MCRTRRHRECATPHHVVPKTHAVERFLGHTLSSSFQPIFGLAHRGVIGHEALLRVHDEAGRPVSPLTFFHGERHTENLLYSDWLSRCLHLRNFVRQTNGKDGWLFLNFHPNVNRTGHSRQFRFTEELLRIHGIEPKRVVVEILEQGFHDESRIVDIVDHYRSLGCLIAVDDFGAGEANFDRIWKLKADIVKLDRSLIVQAARDNRARAFLSSISGMLHQAGKLVLLEGIETEEQTLIAMDADVDFVQGYHLARPTPNLTPTRAAEPLLALLSGRLLDRERENAHHQTRELNKRIHDFLALIKKRVNRKKPVQHAKRFEKYLHNPGVRRCFVLDENGIQLGSNLEGCFNVEPSRRPLSPLTDARGADWSRRDYFRRAMRYFGQVQVTGPYFSLPDAQDCVTLSMAVRHKNGQVRVYCCDLAWERAVRPQLLIHSHAG